MMKELNFMSRQIFTTWNLNIQQNAPNLKKLLLKTNLKSMKNI